MDRWTTFQAIRVGALFLLGLILGLPTHAPAKEGRLVKLQQCEIFERAERRGGDTTLILLNGIPVTSSIYDALATSLVGDGADWTILQVDAPGTGRSKMVASRFTWYEQRSCLKEYLADKPGAFVVVHDMIGPVFLPLLAEQRAHYGGVIILNTILRTEGFRPVFPMSLLRSRPFGRIAAALSPPIYYRYQIKKLGLTEPERVSKAQLNQLYKQMSEHRGRQTLVTVLRGFQLNSAYEEELIRGLATDVPQLVIWAPQDPALGYHYQYIDQERQAHPNRQVEVVENAKHFFMMDHADQVSSLMIDWIEGMRTDRTAPE